MFRLRLVKRPFFSYIMITIHLHSMLKPPLCCFNQKKEMITDSFPSIIISFSFLYILIFHSIHGLYLESVAYTPNSLNILWLRSVKFYLFSNLFDMHCYSSNISNRFHIPNFSKQLIFCIDVIWIFC